MKERLIELREIHLNKTQKEMAEKLNISRATYGRYETGEIKISDRVIIDICREFHINENWLRTGEEPILVQRTQKDEMKDKISKIIDKLDEEEISILQGIAEKIKGII